MTLKAQVLAILERAIKAFAAALLGIVTTNATDVTHLDWGQALSTAGYAALISVLINVASLKLGANDGPSLTTETLTTTDAVAPPAL